MRRDDAITAAVLTLLFIAGALMGKWLGIF